MAYSTSNPPVLVRNGGIDNTGPAEWTYKSADAASVVAASGYFTNAKNLGMAVDDLVTVINTATSPRTATKHLIVSINATTGAADLSDGTSEVASANSG